MRTFSSILLAAAILAASSGALAGGCGGGTEKCMSPERMSEAASKRFELQLKQCPKLPPAKEAEAKRILGVLKRAPDEHWNAHMDAATNFINWNCSVVK